MSIQKTPLLEEFLGWLMAAVVVIGLFLFVAWLTGSPFD